MPPCYQTPTVYSPQTNVSVKNGTNATLTCIKKLEKDCSAQYQAFYWRNPQGRIMIKNTNTLTSIGRNKDVLMKITIKDVKKSQIGTYKCIARNAHGKSSSGVWLNVEWVLSSENCTFHRLIVFMHVHYCLYIFNQNNYKGLDQTKINFHPLHVIDIMLTETQ